MQDKMQALQREHLESDEPDSSQDGVFRESGLVAEGSNEVDAKRCECRCACLNSPAVCWRLGEELQAHFRPLASVACRFSNPNSNILL